MTNGAETYGAIREGIIKSLIDNWHPDWDDIAEKAYQGFIKDLGEDLSVFCIASDDDEDLESKETPIKSEIIIDVYITDAADCPQIGKNILLSDALAEMFKSYESWAVEKMLENSINALREKLKK